MKLEDVKKIEAEFVPSPERVAENLKMLALDAKELAIAIRILRPTAIYADALNGFASTLFELSEDIESGGATPPCDEIHCDICGDYHDKDSVPLSCATGDGA